jgi:cytosine/adenosine deaminase-related metal-dependent hydrolase
MTDDYELIVRNAYVSERSSTVDIAVNDGLVATIATAVDGTGVIEIDAEGDLACPGFVDSHIHLDQALSAVGERLPKHNDQSFEKERYIERSAAYFEQTSVEELTDAAIAAARMAAANGTLYLRTHTYVDGTVGTKVIEALLAARERLRELVEIQIVAFPQRGFVADPDAQEAAKAALEMGADLLGGIDPASVNCDIEQTINTWFDIATKCDVDLDVHLHDTGSLGTYTIERLVEKTVERGYEGRVTASHAFALADAAIRAGDPRVRGGDIEETLDALSRADLHITTCYPSTPPGMPIARVQDREIAMGHGSDELRDLWVAHGNADPLEGALIESLKLDTSYSYATNEGLERLWQLVTTGGAQVLGLDSYGIVEDTPANLVVLDAPSPQWAIVTQPERSYVIKNGQVVVEDGTVLDVNENGGATKTTE